MTSLQPTQRFSDRVADYVKYRPDYPVSLLEHLIEHYGLQPQHVVSDIGMGTGLLTQLLLKHCHQVYGVEPNANMRAAAEAYLQTYPNFESINGQAEATTLETASMDWIFAGQAFHWFDRQATQYEFSRILNPGGRIALAWNSRLMSDPFQQAYEQFLRTYAPDYAVVIQHRPTAAELAEFFAPATMEMATFDHHQTFDFEGLQGRLLSCSYAPKETAANYGVMMAALRSLFDQYSHDEQLCFRYTTHLYCAQPVA
ncbi:MAG: methyltransferase domain-containing protein [Cyanobacteria bacterium P01_B01_bin.77]